MKTQGQKEHLTKDKYEEFKQELEHLKTKRRKEVADQLEYARSLGDLSENAEYHEARDLQAQVEDRISKLETMLQNVEIISDKYSEKVVVGSTVTVQRQGEKEKQEFRIVGSEEIDTDTGKISFYSPLGEALIGKKKGDEVVVNTPRGEVKYTVINVE
ncbi:MAG: transcription elongation factor GreA [Candidatus Paceibacterota bacterium]